MVEKLNEGLMLIKASGEYERIYDRWLSMEDPWNEWKRYLAPAVLVLFAGLLASAIWVGALRRMVQRATRELAEKNERLRQIQDGLEIAVAERTADLQLANTKLQSEVAERKLAEVMADTREHPGGFRLAGDDEQLRRTVALQPAGERQPPVQGPVLAG